MRLAGVLVLFLSEAAAGLVFPLVIGSMVDTVIGDTGGQVPGFFWWQLVGLGAAALAAGLLTWAGALALARLAETVIAELREAYVTAALSLPRSTVETAGTGDVVTRASDDIAQVSGALPQVLPKVAVSVFTIALVAGGLGSLNPWFLVGFTVTVPFYLLTVSWYLRTAPPVYSADRAAQSVRGQRILGTLTQLPTVSAHRLEQSRLQGIESATWETVRWAMRTRIVQNRLFGRLNLAEALGLFAVLGLGVWLVSTAAASAGAVTAAALLFLRMVTPIEALLFVMDDLQSALAALGRIIGVIRSRPGPAPDTTPSGASAESGDAAEDTAASTVGPQAKLKQSVGPVDAAVLEGVCFSYRAGVPVLRGIDLSLRRGETLALVGASGSGKSTLAAVIAGVHRPLSGRMVLGVSAERTVTIAQETYVFAGTVRENLTLAAPGADDDLLWQTLQQVLADRLVHMLPEGLDTLIGHGGHPLTTAQAQHLALARALLADPELVVLDEATAEADAQDTSLLDQAAAAVTEGRAALVIAHRLSQAAAADRLLLLESGRVTELGTHEELLAAGGAYAQLWNAWALT